MMVTQEQAEEVLAKIKEQFAAYLGDGADDEPVLIKDYAHHRAPYVVSWESGPSEWAYRAFVGGIDEELTEMVQEFQPGSVMHTDPVAEVPGVFCEPVTSFMLGIYEE